MPDKARYFCMGNALVVGLIEKMGKKIKQLYSDEVTSIEQEYLGLVESLEEVNKELLNRVQDLEEINAKLVDNSQIQKEVEGNGLTKAKRRGIVKEKVKV
jgi:DNA (cytosine-5)-methyltransferase 1